MPVDKIPANATHYDSEGNFWWISSPEEADGTGEIWTANGWRTSEISTAFLDTLTRLRAHLLSYELKDNPHYEYEEWVGGLPGARILLHRMRDMIVWAELSDMDGNVVAGTDDLV